MIRISHIAAPAVLGAALAIGATGCADRYKDVPNDAVILREGRNNLTATARHDGTVYVYDSSTRKMLYSGPVTKGDDVRVDPQSDEIRVNDKVVSHQSLDDAHQYKIFEDDRTMNGQPISEDTNHKTVIKENGDSTVVEHPDSHTTVITKPNSDTGQTTIIREK